MVTDAQVGVLRRKRMEGKTQEGAAAAAGMSVRSARKWQHGCISVAAAQAAYVANAAGSLWRGVRERSSAAAGGG